METIRYEVAKCKRCGHQDCECDLDRDQEEYDDMFND